MKNFHNISLSLFVLFLIANSFVFVYNSNSSTNNSSKNSSSIQNSSSSLNTSKITSTSTNNSSSSSTNKTASNYKLGLNVFYKKNSKNEKLKSKEKLKKLNKIKLKLKSQITPKVDSDYNSSSEVNNSKNKNSGAPELKQENRNQDEQFNEIKRLNKINLNNKAKIANKIKKQEQKKQEPEVTTAAALKPTDKLKILNSNDKLNIVLQDWLTIASPQFKEPTIYPSVINPDYTRRKIKLDNKNFRINEFYKKKTYNNKNYPPSNLSFWFRYSDKNLYYSNTPETLQVLDAISIKEIKNITQETSDDYSDCINLSTEFKVWYLCSNDIQVRHKWFCQMKSDLGVSLESCKELILEAVEATVNETRVTQPIIMIPLPSEECNANWNFLKQGEDWECECKEGKEQSPINIDTAKLVASPVKPVFFYESAPFNIPSDSLDGYYKKNDKTRFTFSQGFLSIKHPNFGSAATLDGVLYRAQEIRFHTPAQHSINNKIHDMEVEVIHYGETKGSIHKQLVLSVIFERYPGVYNKFIDDLDPFTLPNPLNPQKELLKDLHVNKLLFSSEEDGFMQMKNFDFFTYQGSLTTPPCTENTIRIIVSEPVRLGSTILTLFKEAIKMPDVVDEEGNVTVNNDNLTNNRKTQALNGRKIWYFQSPNKDSLVFQNKSVERPEGHYEKVVKHHTAYYEVSNDQPSGVPGAFVVSEAEARGKGKEFLG